MPHSKSRRKIVSLRLTSAEHALAVKAAKRLGISLNEYLASVSVGAAYMLDTSPAERPERPSSFADLMYFADVQRKGEEAANAMRR